MWPFKEKAIKEESSGWYLLERLKMSQAESLK